MKYQKLSADCTGDLYDKVKVASEFERRTISNFIRVACEERANEIIEIKEDGGN